MATPGKFSKLHISRIVDFGVYLDAEQLGEILLPMKWVPEGSRPDDLIEVFIYFDSEDRLIATTKRPFAQVGEFALLRARAVNDVGAFLDWGLDKDLLVPYREQKSKMIAGKSYMVYLFADPKTGRLAGSAKIEKFIEEDTSELKAGDEVSILVWARTDLGYKAIINSRFEGLLYDSEIFTELAPGMKTTAWVVKVREDGKVDLNLNKPGYQKVDVLSEKIIELLKEHQGYIGISDKSEAEEIYLMFGMSKKTFKKAIGGLFKQRIILIEEHGIRLKQ